MARDVPTIDGSTALPAGFDHPHASEEARQIAERGTILRRRALVGWAKASDEATKLTESSKTSAGALTTLLIALLDDYSKGSVDLRTVVFRVEELIDGLPDSCDPAWVQRLREEWADLDLVYAIASSEGRQPDESEVGTIVGSLRVLASDPR